MSAEAARALVTFVSEAPPITREFGDDFGLIDPQRTIPVENPVSLVDAVVDRRSTRKLAEAYLQFLCSPEGQEIAARHNLRPSDAKVLARHAKAFPKVETFTVDEVFGGWTQAQKDHFNDGAGHDPVILAAKGRSPPAAAAEPDRERWCFDVRCSSATTSCPASTWRWASRCFASA